MEPAGKVSIFWQRVCEVLWAIALICLPVTTFPLFSSLTGALVAPLSILPFFVLFVIWVLPLLLTKGNLPKESIPLAYFTLAIILSCGAAFFLKIPGFKGKSITGQELRALFTLAVGLTCYLVTASWINTTPRLKKTWQYITIGGIISLIWTGIQAFYILHHADQYPQWMEHIQSWFVVPSPAFSIRNGRVNGLTYEASWFAHQMVLIYLPIWFAASYYKTSAFKFRLWRFSIENFLLFFGLTAFFLSSPRIGLVSFLLIIIYIFMKLNLAVYRKLVDNISRLKFVQEHKSPGTIRSSIRIITSLAIIMIYALVLGSVVFFASQRDRRLAILISEPPTRQEIIGLLTLDQNTLLDLSHRLIFLERMVYWLNGWNIFNQYPWFGVGLGNAGFFFPQYAPSMGWASFEIRNALFYLPQLPNIKSFWFRLLAETGLIGFSLFLAWYYILFRSSRFSQHSQDPIIKTFAMAGLLALLAFIGEGFSIDSFAMPYFWVAAGIISAIGIIRRRDFGAQDHS
jgi:hypothetical protein